MMQGSLEIVAPNNDIYSYNSTQELKISCNMEVTNIVIDVCPGSHFIYQQ